MPVASHDNLTTFGRRLTAGLGSAALGLLVLACGGDDPESAGGPSTTVIESTTTSTRRSISSTTSTTTPDTSATTTTTSTDGGGTAEQEVIDRYIGYWEARTAANTGVPNPAAPGLAEFATGEQLAVVVAETQENLDNGLAFRPAEQPIDFQEVRVVSVQGDVAVVQECVVDDQVIFRRDTGEVVNDEVATRNVRGELTRVDGHWRLARAELVQRWEGVGGCALDG